VHRGQTTADLEDALGMTSGNIFHGALGWPFAEDDEPPRDAGPALGSHAHNRILWCGAASPGGGVSDRWTQRRDGRAGG
jgi:phytoene dehydrogenase-like protein